MVNWKFKMGIGSALLLAGAIIGGSIEDYRHRSLTNTPNSAPVKTATLEGNLKTQGSNLTEPVQTYRGQPQTYKCDLIKRNPDGSSSISYNICTEEGKVMCNITLPYDKTYPQRHSTLNVVDEQGYRPVGPDETLDDVLKEGPISTSPTIR